MLAMQEEAKRIRQLIIEHRRKKCCKDYKTWAYMICVASILIGTVVLIILAGMGLVKVNWKLTGEGSHLYHVFSYRQARQFSQSPNLRYRLRGQMLWPCQDFPWVHSEYWRGCVCKNGHILSTSQRRCISAWVDSNQRQHGWNIISLMP